MAAIIAPAVVACIAAKAAQPALLQQLSAATRRKRQRLLPQRQPALLSKIYNYENENVKRSIWRAVKIGRHRATS